MFPCVLPDSYCEGCESRGSSICRLGDEVSDLVAEMSAAGVNWKWNPKVIDSGIITCIPQTGLCPNGCPDCFFQSGRSYLEPLEENLPHIPPSHMAKGRVVRMNDGNDSNVKRDIVIKAAAQFDDVFFNTAIPEFDLPGPVVLTVNPYPLTDTGFHKVDPVPHNLMYVRVRTNMWNITTVVDPVVEHYMQLGISVVLTFMAYYDTEIMECYRHHYEWRKRTVNSYHAIKYESWLWVMNRYRQQSCVYSCGREGVSSLCRDCGNCLREYFHCKERIRQYVL